MAKVLIQATFAFYLSLCTMIFSGKTAYAQSKIDPATMQRHIEEVKLKNPAKYQAMVQKAGGNITTCTDCHKIEQK